MSRPRMLFIRDPPKINRPRYSCKRQLFTPDDDEAIIYKEKSDFLSTSTEKVHSTEEGEDSKKVIQGPSTSTPLPHAERNQYVPGVPLPLPSTPSSEYHDGIPIENPNVALSNTFTEFDVEKIQLNQEIDKSSVIKIIQDSDIESENDEEIRRSVPTASKPYRRTDVTVTLGTDGRDHYTLQRENELPLNHFSRFSGNDQLPTRIIKKYIRSPPTPMREPQIPLTSNDLRRAQNYKPPSPIFEKEDDFVAPPGGYPLLPRYDENIVSRSVDDEIMARFLASLPPEQSYRGEPRVEMIWNVEELKKANAARAGVPYVPEVYRDLSEIPAFQPGNEMPSLRERRKQDNKEEAKEKAKAKLVRRGMKKKLKKKSDISWRGQKQSEEHEATDPE